MKLARLNRSLHRWGAAAIAAPVLLVVLTGILLVLNKECAWIQPPTQMGSSQELHLSFDQILEIVKRVPEDRIARWEDIGRVDVRPSKGTDKVRGTDRWEVQVDARNGGVPHVARRRTRRRHLRSGNVPERRHRLEEADYRLS